jgi:phosphinothricin acetyltransferase
MIIRPALVTDVPALTEIRNHYVVNTHVTFDVRPFSLEEGVGWFRDHSDGRRYRLLLAEDSTGRVLGYAGTGRFRAKEAYDTTVEVTIACRPEAIGKRLGTALYESLFPLLDPEGVHLVVAGIAQPNAASNALHERFGFRPIGTFPEVGWKLGRFWDVLWMGKAMSRE